MTSIPKYPGLSGASSVPKTSRSDQMACAPIPSKSQSLIRIDMYAERVGDHCCSGFFTREQVMEFSRELWRAAQAIAE